MATAAARVPAAHGATIAGKPRTSMHAARGHRAVARGLRA
jgi:hypothetical protein